MTTRVRVYDLEQEVGEMKAESAYIARLGKKFDATAPCAECGVMRTKESMVQLQSHEWMGRPIGYIWRDEYRCPGCYVARTEVEEAEERAHALNEEIKRIQGKKAQDKLKAEAGVMVYTIEKAAKQ